MTRSRRSRSSALGIVTTVAVAAGAAVLAQFSSVAEGLPMPMPDEWLATTTTTSPGEVADTIPETVDGTIASAIDGTPLDPGSSSTSTSTTTSTTTTTTAPAAAHVDPSTDDGDGGTTPQPDGLGNGAPVARPVRNTATSHRGGSLRNVAPTAAPAGDAPASAALPASGLPARSVVLLDAPAIAAAQALPGGRSTRPIFDRLAGLDLAPSIIAQVLAPFPVAGTATYSDDWGALRLNPFTHRHEGTDIFAAFGTPVIASAGGKVSHFVTGGAVGGTSLRLTTVGGTYFYYAHLDRFSPTLREGKEVGKGDVLGFVGATGNADGTSPHLHYEIHPGGGAPVNPVPYLDRWLAEAALAAASVQGAPAAAAELLAAQPRTEVGSIRSSRARQPIRHAVAPPPVHELGDVQSISSVAIAPGGVILAASALYVVVGRMRRNRRWKRADTR